MVSEFLRTSKKIIGVQIWKRLSTDLCERFPSESTLKKNPSGISGFCHTRVPKCRPAAEWLNELETLSGNEFAASR